MMAFRQLAGDRSGSGAIEFAIALPVLVMFMWGIIQVALVHRASAGMQHALGEAARLATIYPTPSDAEIQARITDKKFGVDNGTWSTPTITTNAAAGTKLIEVTYSQPTDFLFFNGPTVSITRSKLVYVAT